MLYDYIKSICRFYISYNELFITKTINKESGKYLKNETRDVYSIKDMIDYNMSGEFHNIKLLKVDVPNKIHLNINILFKSLVALIILGNNVKINIQYIPSTLKYIFVNEHDYNLNIMEIKSSYPDINIIYVK